MMNILRYGQIVLISLTLLPVSICGQKSQQNEEFNSGIVESVFRYQITHDAHNKSSREFNNYGPGFGVGCGFATNSFGDGSCEAFQPPPSALIN